MRLHSILALLLLVIGVAEALAQTAVPQPVPPGGTAPQLTLQQRAMNFVVDDMRHSEEPPAQYLDYVSRSMDDQVDYYGKITPRADVLKDKERYVARWPNRSYQLRPDSIRTSCDEGKSTCRIEGIVDFSLSNPDNGKKSSGASSFEFSIRFGADGGRIVYESGKILAAPKKK